MTPPHIDKPATRSFHILPRTQHRDLNDNNGFKTNSARRASTGGHYVLHAVSVDAARRVLRSRAAVYLWKPDW